MSVIRVVWGTGTGPTETAAYDAALAAAGIHDYNLVTVSSVIPAGPPVESAGTAPDLGPAGEQLTVVQGKATVAPGADEPAVAAIGWARAADGPGIFYEESGTDPDGVRETVCKGLERGVALREWDPVDRDLVIRSAESDPDAVTCVVVCAVYGESRPLV